LGQTLHALRSTGVTPADAAKASPRLLTSAITQCETLQEALQVGGCACRLEGVCVERCLQVLQVKTGPSLLHCRAQP
jgi:hypothetical protein